MWSAVVFHWYEGKILEIQIKLLSRYQCSMPCFGDNFIKKKYLWNFRSNQTVTARKNQSELQNLKTDKSPSFSSSNGDAFGLTKTSLKRFYQRNLKKSVAQSVRPHFCHGKNFSLFTRQCNVTAECAAKKALHVSAWKRVHRRVFVVSALIKGRVICENQAVLVNLIRTSKFTEICKFRKLLSSRTVREILERKAKLHFVKVSPKPYR